MPILLNKTLRLFLDSIGRRDEYEFYLDKFHNDQTTSFAILCPEPPGFEEVASVFTFDISFLLQVELFPVVLLAGPGASGMRDLLLHGDDHPYAPLSLAGASAGDIDTGAVETFLLEGRRQVRAGLLVAPDADREALLQRLLPRVAARLHFIRVRGPLRDAAEEPLQYVYTRRPNERALSAQDVPLAEEAGRLLQAHPGAHISVASPWKLLQELFTVKGAGCVVRRGSRIVRLQDPAALDRRQVADLLRESFGRPLHNLDLFDKVSDAYVEEEGRGAALLERHPAGAYLSKFAIGTQARGEGLANELWSEVVRDHPRLFWRARAHNPINHWYERHADGGHRAGDWRVFWRGVDVADLPAIIDACLRRPDDFAAPPDG